VSRRTVAIVCLALLSGLSAAPANGQILFSNPNPGTIVKQSIRSPGIHVHHLQRGVFNYHKPYAPLPHFYNNKIQPKHIQFVPNNFPDVQFSEMRQARIIQSPIIIPYVAKMNLQPRTIRHGIQAWVQPNLGPQIPAPFYNSGFDQTMRGHSAPHKIFRDTSIFLLPRTLPPEALLDMSGNGFASTQPTQRAPQRRKSLDW